VLKQENSMPFSEDDKVMIKKFTLLQRLRFTIISRISYEKVDERRALYTAEEREGNWKH